MTTTCPDNSDCPVPPVQPLSIDRCVCADVTFKTMAEWVQKQRELDPRRELQFNDVRGEFRCGVMCGLCRPYVRRMLETGETSFEAVMEESTSISLDEPTTN